MKRLIKTTFMCIFICFISTVALAFDQVMYACSYGIDDDFSGPCNNQEGARYAGRFLCGTSIDNMARQMCDIHTPTGVISVPYDKPVVVRNTGGGECGYTGIKITCHVPEPALMRIDRGDVVPCGQEMIGAARAYCKRANRSASSVTVFPRTQQSGGRCGWTTVSMLCYK